MAIRIPADITDAFSHLMMVGLASILEDDDSGRHCMIRWVDFRHAELTISDDLDMEAVSVIASNHAERWSSMKHCNLAETIRFPVREMQGRALPCMPLCHQD